MLRPRSCFAPFLATVLLCTLASLASAQSRGYVWSVSFAPEVGQPFTLWIGREGTTQPGDRALTPFLYATAFDHATGRSGATVVLHTRRACACPLAFLATLAAGTWEIGYYDTETPNFDRPADASLEVIVAQGPTRAIEYVNAQRGHFLVTADAEEIALLDMGAFEGWSRTGESFKVGPANANPGAQPVCRLYGRPEAGLDTHFLSDDPSECEAVLARWPDKWIVESRNAFTLPDSIDFPCGSDPYGPAYIPIYRLYNNRPGANHRYTTSRQVRDEMMAAGWILESRANGEWSCTAP